MASEYPNVLAVEPSSPLLRKDDNDSGFPSRTSWRDFLLSDVDSDHATGPLAVFCFMTGFIDAISFTAVFVWCGFQTGNFAQLALAVARCASTREIVFSIADQQALLSLIAFNIGAFSGRIGDRIGAQTRAWLISGTAAQAALTIVAGICIQQSGQGSIAIVRGEPTWTNTLSSLGLALMAASLGLQGIMGKRLNTQFSTTVVLTAVWVELVSDPHLFVRRKVTSRDHKVLALVALFAGAVLARLLLRVFGAAATLGVGAGIRIFVAGAWCFVRSKGDGYTRLWDREPPQDASETDLIAPAPAAEVPSYGAVSNTSPKLVDNARWW
ncbi:hypothetical protein C8F04DRAFT_630488 [Mycena alexandri]|uniref:DUF1275 domain protein n=1 Tax=Mycena alexandri TaxID=1745969 RepID=A0AAD6SS79_9AGAR|nr:hypothetical protein C8F04DRAFT_630488 [Mycena alexandri]